jgi:MYXO-CTERM domain-containing protein
MRRLVLLACCVTGLALPAPVRADGGPATSVQLGAGVSSPDGRLGYVAVPAGPNTVVEQIRRLHGAVRRARMLPGWLGTVAIGTDRSATGLSGDGRTLVLQLIPRRYPQRDTRLVVLDAHRLKPRGETRLRGQFVLDAVSPHGRWLYLLHSLSARNALRYEVRAYDLARHRLLAGPIVDQREPDEKMLGVGVTRVSSAGGRWAYTFYDDPGGKPFVHALDTQGRRAFCVDLPTLKGASQVGLRLRLARDERELRVETAAGTQALVDTRTFAVRRPAPDDPRAPADAQITSGGDGVPWIGAAVLAAALLGLAALWRRRRATPTLGGR